MSVLGLAKFRPLAPLIAFSSKPATLRKLALVWGVAPLPLGATRTVDEGLASATNALLNQGRVRSGDIVVFTAGAPIGAAGGANLIKVVKMEPTD